MMLFATDGLAGQPARFGGVRDQPMMRLFAHLLAYKVSILIAAILGLIVSAVGLSFVTPHYEAEAVMIVDSRRNKLADAESALSSIVVDQYQSALKSELDILSSPDIARHVITSLGLLDTPDYSSVRTHVSMATRFRLLRDELARSFNSLLSFARLRTATAPEAAKLPMGTSEDASSAAQAVIMESAVQTFDKLFVATNDPKSLTIRLRYRSTSPQLAAAVTNAVLRQYLVADEELKASAADRSQTWLKDRISALRVALDETEHSVEEFRASHDLATIRDRSPLQQELLQLQGQRVYMQAQLSAAQAKVDRDRAAGGIAAQAASSDVLSSRLIQGLRQQEAALVAEQVQLSSSRLPTDPSMIKIAGELAGVRTAIRDEVQRIVQSNQSDLTLSQTGVANVSARIEAVQEKINAANAADIKLRSLEADAAAKREVLNTFTERYDQHGGEPLTPPDGRVVSWASVPIDASSPKYGLVLVGGTLGFGFAAFCLSLLRERLRSGFDDTHELEQELGLVVAGLTAAHQKMGSRSPIPHPIFANAPPAMHDLALTVRAMAHTPGGLGTNSVVLVTSALAGEGKSTVALSLARSVAAGGQRCLLVDGDIHNPSLHASLGMPATPGLVELTIDRVPINLVARTVPGERFDFLSAGRPTLDTLSPFTTDALGKALAALKTDYNVIVVDSAPVLLASEVLVLVGVSDLTLLLVKWRTTPRNIAQKAATLISRCSAGPCVTVLSQADVRRMRRGSTYGMGQYHRDAHRFS